MIYLICKAKFLKILFYLFLPHSTVPSLVTRGKINCQWLFWIFTHWMNAKRCIQGSRYLSIDFYCLGLKLLLHLHSTIMCLSNYIIESKIPNTRIRYYYLIQLNFQRVRYKEKLLRWILF